MSPSRKATICWIFALLSGLLGVFCWVKDPFFTSEGIGSGISFLAGCAGVGISLVLVMVGLILTRRYLLMLGLFNLVVFIAAVMFLGRGEYLVSDNAVASFISRTHWGWVFVLITVSVLLSVAVYVRLLKSRKEASQEE